MASSLLPGDCPSGTLPVGGASVNRSRPGPRKASRRSRGLVLRHDHGGGKQAAALAGLSDALGSLESGEDAHALAASALVARLQALPAPTPDEATGKRKAKA